MHRGVSAKVLVKGDKDIRAALNNFVEGRPYTVEKLQLKLPFDRNLVSIYLANNGIARISEEVLDDLLPLLRISLPNSLHM